LDTILKLLTAPWRACITASQQFLMLTLAARIAWTVAFLQFFVVCLALGIIFSSGGAAVFEAWWTPGKAVTLLALMAVIPFLVYYSAHLWLHHEAARWHDIDKAWREALVELDRQGIDLSTTPLFLVLGSDGDRHEQTLFANTPITFDVRAAPQGSAPLHIYAGTEGIFVCLSTVGQTCKLMPHDGAVADSAAPLRSVERAEASDRLRTLCERIRNARQPIAPANGIIALVPAMATGQTQLGMTFGSALSADLLTITVSFGLRMPLTVVGVGVDKMLGFQTLLDRLPPETKSLPLGEVFPVGRHATDSEIAALTMAACGRLADRVGNLLLDPKSLAHSADNRRLVNLLCQLRLQVAPLLQSILQHGLEYASHSDAPPTLAGCFLMPGESKSSQLSFSDGVLARVLDVQGDLEWTRTALDRNRRYGYVARSLLVLNLLMAAAWTSILWWRISR
jgi:hypothetical protein